MTDIAILTENASAACTDTTRPVIQRDPILYAGAAGARFLFDALDTYCNPNADGALASGAILNNLVSGGAAATVSGTSIGSLAGKAGLAFSGGGGALNIGAAGTYDLHASGDEFYVDIFFKTPTTGFATGFYPTLMTLTTGNANVAQWFMDMGSDGKTPRVGAGTGPGSNALNNGSGWNLGAVTHMGLHFKASTGLMEMYGNGVLVGAANVGAQALQNAATATVQINGAYKGVIYGAYLEDLTLSGNSAASVAAARWANNNGRYV